MPPYGELLVLTDTPSLDYETLATHLWRVSYHEFREAFTLIVDYSNGPLATLLEQYAEREHVPSRRIVRSLNEGLNSADSVLLFTAPKRRTVFDACQQTAVLYDEGGRSKPLKIHTVIHEDTSRG